MTNIYGTGGTDVIVQNLPTPAEFDAPFPIIYSLDGDDRVVVHHAIVEGGAGNNTYEALNGGPYDYSVLSYRESPNSVSIDLTQHQVHNGYGGSDSIVGYFGQIWASSKDDTIVLDDSASGYGFVGMGGHDTVIGGSSGTSFMYVVNLHDWKATFDSPNHAIYSNASTGETVDATNIYVIKEFTGATETFGNLRPLNISLADARSFVCLAWNGSSARNDLPSLVKSSKADVIDLGTMNTIVPAILDPDGSKILLGHINITECGYWNGQNLNLPGATIPDWFGGVYSNDPVMHSVQYWNPLWKANILSQIDTIIAGGYDGVFLDSCVPDDWMYDNGCGNPVFADAVQQLAKFVTEIHDYVASKNLSRPFYLVPNVAVPTLLLQSPSTINEFSGIFNEVLFQGGFIGSDNTFTDRMFQTDQQKNVLKLSQIAQEYGVPFFGNDYTTLKNLDYGLIFRSFEYYTSLGVVPGVVPFQAPYLALASGPFMAMAVASNPVVAGESQMVNFLSGGLVASATLSGGDCGDYFIGGRGINTIIGGKGNDTIYAHPASTAPVLDLQFISGSVNPHSPPMVEVLVNGQVALAPTQITANYYSSVGAANQEIRIDIGKFGTITSVQIVGVDLYYVGPTEFSNVFLQSASYYGKQIALSEAQCNSGATYLSNESHALLNRGGTITISGASLPVSASLPNASDSIDGGSGLDTVMYSGALAAYSISHSGNTTTLTGSAGAAGTDTLLNVERIKFLDGAIALDVGATQPAGQAAMLLGAVLPGRLVFDVSKQTLLGAVLDLFDQGYSLQTLSGAVMRLPIWDVLTGKATPTNTDMATYLLANVNGMAPDGTTLANAVTSLNAETSFATQGNFLWHLTESSTNQAHVGLVGLTATGLAYGW